MKRQESQIRAFLNDNMYCHPKVRTMTYKAKKIISDLFNLFENEPNLLPGDWKSFKNKSI